MSKTTEKTLRDQYFSNDIFKIGDIVEDTNSGEKMKILDRGSNYVTVASSTGIFKKWLNEITEEVTEIVEVVSEKAVSKSGALSRNTGRQ